MRFIVRQMDSGAGTSEEVARKLTDSGIEVLAQKPKSLLVEGDFDEAQKAARDITGWTLIRESRMPVPDTRPRVIRRAE